MTNELPEGLDEVVEEDIDLIEEVVDEVDEIEVEEPDVNTIIAELTEKVNKLQNVEGLANDLRRSAGRIQSLEQRLQQDASDKQKLNEEISKQFGGLTQLLGDVVNNIDDTAIDPTTKARVQQAYEASRRQAETASLRREAAKDALEELKRQYPQLSGQQTQTESVNEQLAQQAARIEPRVVGMFDAVGEDPDSPNHKHLWDEAATMMREGKSEAEILSHFRSSLSPAENSDTRRQRTKQRAGNGSPTPAGTGDSELKYTGDLNKDLEALKALGVSI
jgi:chromosome segregation ATPase